MSERGDWDEIVGRIREEAEPLRSRHMNRLYEVAVRDGRMFLRSFQAELGDERVLDLIHDVLATALSKILAAETPRGFFCTALTRRAISWKRLKGAAVAETPPESSRSSEAGPSQEDRRAFILDANEMLHGLSERDREVLVGVGRGEDRNELAREFKTSRANIDAIVSRARKRFRRGGS